MDTSKQIVIFRGTLDPAQRKEAEEELDQMKKLIGFGPSLLQMVMATTVDMPIRQAGAIYLKIMIIHHWLNKDIHEPHPIQFTLQEQDRSMIRDSLVDALVYAPESIQNQLSVCIYSMIKHDFPTQWPQIVDKISIYLKNPESAGWGGALICVYQLVKNFQYKKAQEERVPLYDAMNLLLPLINELFIQLLPDESEQAVLLQKQILKIYFALTQFVLPLNLITKEMFAQWMEIFRQIADRPVPANTNSVDEVARPNLPWWKCKKWALQILHRMFERYGSPGNVEKEYQDFSQWFLPNFSARILEVLLKILDQYTKKVYISPRVIQLTLNYLTLAVRHGHSWKFLKDHMFSIIQDVLFPLLSYSQVDEKLWTSDPKEYIRVKFDIYQDLVSPVSAAAILLLSSCKRRKNMLDRTMLLIRRVLASCTTKPRQRDGALFMAGSLADILLKKKPYKEQMEQMLIRYVYPEFKSPLGHMRARACWVIHYCHQLKFRSDENLATAVSLIANALLTDSDLPVRVEAAIALHNLLIKQEKAEVLLFPQVKPITLELLRIIRLTENDEVVSVLQKFVCTYSDQIALIASVICQQLATVFSTVVDTYEGNDARAITAVGLLSTIESLISMMEDQPVILALLQPTVFQVVAHIFTQGVIDFYEEASSLVYDLTTKTVSPDMWTVFEIMYQVFEQNGLDYFIDMMPALHNYVVVDTPAFLSNQNHVLAMYNMCKVVLTVDAGEDSECHAAKLLEVIILQCKGQIDQCIPSFIELVLQRLTKEIETSELRAMCLQVVIAALYYNPQLWVETMDKIQLSVSPSESICAHFIKQWIHDADCFLGLHDRKLCVLGLSTLIAMGPNRPVAVNECASTIIPCLILVFKGLKLVYAAKDRENQEEELEEEATDNEKVLSTDEDEINLHSGLFLKAVGKVHEGKKSTAYPIPATMQQDGNEDDEDDDQECDPYKSELESYTTPLDKEETEIDEYVVFKKAINAIESEDPMWYTALTANLTPVQQNSLREVLVHADERKAVVESKQIEQSGGYSFVNQTVPTSFSFGGKPTFGQ